MRKASLIKILRKIKHSIQSFFRYFRFKNILKVFNIKKILLSNGYSRVKGFKIYLWKKYSNYFIVFFKCRKENKDYFIKVTNKANQSYFNTIKKINEFNEEFFLNTFLFEQNNIFFIVSAYINHYNFSDMRDIKSVEILDNLLNQLNYILDSFYKNKIVYFDLNQKNIIIEKKTWLIKVIDYDTLFYGQKDFKINFQSFLHTKEGRTCIYDDVYTVVWYLKKYKNNLIYNLDNYKKLISKIGRFVYKVEI